MITVGFAPTNDEQNELNQQSPACGCKNRSSVANSSFSSFCSSLVGTEPAQWTGLLEEWRLGLDRMRGHPPPPNFSERVWHELKIDALALFATHASRLVVLGWRTEELFGLHRDHPSVCVAASGLARFIHTGAVIEITGQLASIRRLTGSVLTYRRTDPQPGAVPAWELHQQGE